MGTFQWRGKSGDSWRFWSFQRFPKKQLYLSHPIVLEDLDCQNKSGKCKDILQMYNLLFRCERWVRNYNFFLFFSASIEKVFFSIEKVVQHFVIFIISILSYEIYLLIFLSQKLRASHSITGSWQHKYYGQPAVWLWWLDINQKRDFVASFQLIHIFVFEDHLRGREHKGNWYVRAL